MVIDINGSYSENLDLTCQNIRNYTVIYPFIASQQYHGTANLTISAQSLSSRRFAILYLTIGPI